MEETRLPMTAHRHLSDLRVGLLLRGTVAITDEAVLRNADLCANVIAEARHLCASNSFGPALGQLLARARELLVDLDEALLRLDHDKNRPVFTEIAALHTGLSELEARRDEFEKSSDEPSP